MEIQDQEDKYWEDEDNEELYEHYQIVADPKQSPIRIDKFLMDRVERLSRNKIQNAIKAGSIRVDDKQIKPNFRIKPGHRITIVFPKPPKDGAGVAPEDIPLDIRFEDDHLLVIHKPAGLVVHPGIGNPNGTLVNALAFHFKGQDLPVKEGNLADRPGLVHRIDKDTTGLMVIAKDEYAMTHLAKQFFDHTIERKYLALVWGEPEPSEGTIEGHIGRHLKNRMQMDVFPDGEYGKSAVTHYKTVEGLYYVSLVECKLETGRTHQIRAHMKYLGHTLFNDARYGGDRILKGTVFSKYKQFVMNCFDMLPRHALHAKSLGFTHPYTGEQLFFEADLPEDFQQVLDRWRRYLDSRKTL